VELLREELGIEAELVKGHGGIFTVAVDGRVVARKTWAGFPEEEEILREVQKAVGA
jgi:predicted Rdx family selenoprotein